MELIDQELGIAMLGCALAALILASGLTITGGHPGALPWATAMSVACAVAYFRAAGLAEPAHRSPARGATRAS